MRYASSVVNGPNPYAAPGSEAPPVPATPPPPEVSVVAAIRWSFAGVGIGNLALGLLLLFIPMVGGLLLMGWMAETHRRLALRVGPSVPKFTFSEFGNFLMAGLPPFAVQMAVSFVLMVPLGVLGGMGAAFALAGSSGGGLDPTLMIAVLGGGGLLCVVLAFLVSALTMAMMVRGELSGSIKEAFNLRDSWAFAKRNFGALLGHHMLLGVLALPLMALGVLALFIGLYIVAIALQFASLHIRWQIYERDVARGAEPIFIRTQPGADL
jgi:hypothetical protein